MFLDCLCSWRVAAFNTMTAKSWNGGEAELKYSLRRGVVKMNVVNEFLRGECVCTSNWGY